MNQVYFYTLASALPWLRFLPVPEDKGLAVLSQLTEGQLAYLWSRTNLFLDDSAPVVLRRTRSVSILRIVFSRQRLFPLDNSVRGRRHYATVRRSNWRAVRWLMLHGLNQDDREIVNREYAGRMETYHALGGSRYAGLTGTIIVAGYNGWVHRDVARSDPWNFLIAGLVIFFLFLGVLYVLGRARQNTSRVAQELVIDSLRSCTPELGLM